MNNARPEMSLLRKAKVWAWEPDKLQHILICLILVQGLSSVMSLVASIAVTFAVGLGKELWDHFYGAGFSWGDIIANIAGIVIGVALMAFM